MKRIGRDPARPSLLGRRRKRAAQTSESEPSRAQREEILRCRDCGVFSQAGSWTWDAPLGARPVPTICPACRRIHDRFPAGTLRLHLERGALRDELLALIRDVEQQERHEHPLERLMELHDAEDYLAVATTGIHLARCIATALERRSHGRVRMRFGAEGTQVRVDWRP